MKFIVFVLLALLAYLLYRWRTATLHQNDYELAKLEDYTPKHALFLASVDPVVELPTYFKWRENILVPVRNQGKCASCWCFAVADCVADRVSILTGGKVRNNLSVQELLSCFNPSVFHCRNGGVPEVAYHYVIANGLHTETNYPYKQLVNHKVQRCTEDNSLLSYVTPDPFRHENNKDKVFGRSGSNKDLCVNLKLVDEDSLEYNETHQLNVTRMKQDIFANGPIVGTMFVRDDLYSYDGESVYSPRKGAKLRGGHAIEIFGWCEDNVNTEEKGFDSAYWICRNSWSSGTTKKTWPLNLSKVHNGWFYVKMGSDTCGIESRASSVQPLLNSSMYQYSKSQNRNELCYTSYSDYVNDPERVNFFSHLQERRRVKKL